MSFLDSLERKYGRFSVNNLTYYLIIRQVVAFVASYTNPQYASFLPLSGDLLMGGQWWRLLTFIFIPLSYDVIWAALTWYVFYMYGMMLESRMGAFQLMIYLIISYVGSILAALLFPHQVVTNSYMYTSLFLAFAHLYPDMRLLFFFILPVKVKWLGILAWIGIAVTLLSAPVPGKVLVLLSISNFFVFFGRHFIFSLQKTQVQKQLKKHDDYKVKNICALCGRYEMEHPGLEFRYCMDCHPVTCYCMDHVNHHRHKRKFMVN